MKKLIIATIFLGSLFYSTTTYAQIDIKFSPTTDLSQYIYSGTTEGVIENKKSLKVIVLEGKDWSAIFYKPVGGISFGSDQFVVVKSSKKRCQLKVTSDTDSYGFGEGKWVKSADGESYIHTYRLSDLKPQNPVTTGVYCKNVQFGTFGLMGGDVVLLEWVKSFPDEASAIQYVKTVEKLDAKF